MIKSFIGKRVRELRTARGYSQEKCAAVCGLDRTYIAGVELGKRNISIENLNKIAEGLEITLAELCNRDIPPHHTILLNVNGERFLLESKQELTREIKDEIEIICQCAYESEDNPILDAAGEGYTIDDLYEASIFDMAGLFQKAVKEQLGLDVHFKAIDLEVSILEQ